MRNVTGRECSLAVYTDDTYYPLPFKEETLRETVKGYYLASTVGCLGRGTFIKTGCRIEGCIVTRLDESSILPIFSLIANPEKPFEVLVNRITERKVYSGLRISSFELRAENRGAFYFKLNLTGKYNTSAADWDMKYPDCVWQKNRTALFNGLALEADGVKLPVIYLMSLAGSLLGIRKSKLFLHTPLQTGSVLSRAEPIGMLKLPVYGGTSLIFTSLVPETDMTDIDCGSEILVTRRYRTEGSIIIEKVSGTGCEKVEL